MDIISKCKCLNPTIILHPLFHEMYLNSVAIYLNGITHQITSVERNKYSISSQKLYYYLCPKNNNITIDNYDRNYFIDRFGNTFCIFLVVACGKCTLCCDKKAKEWSVRCIAENIASNSCPYFITLTYADCLINNCKLVKSDVQKFIKRLRINLFNSGHPCDIRYVAVGEYGSKRKRPHYHLLLWNLPNMNNHNLLRIIQRAWSLRGKSIGFCYLGKVERGGVNYVLKYMRKPCTDDVEKLYYPTFFLASRRPAIGKNYALRYRDYYLNNPQDMTFQVKDLFTSVKSCTNIPSYFKSLYFPDRSKFFGNLFSKNIKALRAAYIDYKTFIATNGVEVVSKVLSCPAANLERMYNEVVTKYGKYFNLKLPSKYPFKKLFYIKPFFDNHNRTADMLLDMTKSIIYDSYNYIMSKEYDLQLYEKILKGKQVRLDKLSVLDISYNITLASEKCEKILNGYDIRDKF